MTEIWTPPKRSDATQAIFDAAEADRAARPHAYELDADRLLAKVTERHVVSHGAPIPLDATSREGLSTYLTSPATDGRLNAVGTKVALGSASSRLAARFRLDALLNQQPEIASRSIVRPIFIIGGWRTGTTLLQRLMAAVPALRAAYPAELSAPWAAPRPSERQRWDAFLDQRDAQAALDALNPMLKTVHPFGNREAEECVLAMGTDFQNWGFPSTVRLDAYVEWLERQSFDGSYERYCDVLRILQGSDEQNSKVPTRWVLKAPAHTAELASLLRAFPDACVIHLHRDVVSTITSGCSLFAVFRSTYSDEVDPVHLGEYQLETTACWFERSMAARDALAAGSIPEAAERATLIELDFGELVADPAAMVKHLCRELDVDLGDDVDDRLSERLAHLNNQHGTHRYAPEQFGLDPDRIRERLADYRTRFGVS